MSPFEKFRFQFQIIQHRGLYHKQFANTTANHSFPVNSVVQPIIADRNLGGDLDVDSFVRAACVECRHLTGDGRTADAQFARHLFPERTNQSRLGIDSLLKILHDPPSEIKRNLRRTPPRISCRPMWFYHINSFFWPLPAFPNQPKAISISPKGFSFHAWGYFVQPMGLIIPQQGSHNSLLSVSLIPAIGLIIPPRRRACDRPRCSNFLL